MQTVIRTVPGPAFGHMWFPAALQRSTVFRKQQLLNQQMTEEQKKKEKEDRRNILVMNNHALL